VIEKFDCPECGKTASRVIDSRWSENFYSRIRKCTKCNNLYDTREYTESTLRRLLKIPVGQTRHRGNI